MVDEPEVTENLLELRDVSLVYRALPALRNINWAVSYGQQWACLGPNGAGKTSLAKIISRQATHFSGEMLRSAELDSSGVAYVCFGPGHCANATASWMILSFALMPATPARPYKR
jgi:ABC-type Mn2+/Zn2+ transport system ATPase subunit